MDSESPNGSDNSMSEWDTNVLNLISDEGLTRFTFDGLKRRLGAHPETLSRALSRLEDQDIIEKQIDGYRVASKARKFLGSHKLKVSEPSVPVLQTLLPPDVPVKDVVSDLAGKWFGALRWFGYARTSDGTTLKWITEDGGIQVDANFSEGALSIEAKMLSEKNLNLALRASYQLIGYISRLYSRPGRIQNVSYFTCLDSDPKLAWM
jgi:hypothetical protein